MSRLAPDEDLQQRVRDAERRADEAWTAYHKLAAEVETYKTDSNKLKQLENSISWRMTAPLRLIKWLVNIARTNLPKLRAQRTMQS